MRDQAQEAYNKLQAGETAWIHPNTNTKVALHSFQAVVLAVEDMQKNGLILIRTMHKETASGDNAIDAIQFTKIA